MTVLDVLCSPWAILPDRLEQIHAIYQAHASGERLSPVEIEARIGRPPATDQQTGYQVRNGAAIVPLMGVLGPRMNMMTNMSGGTSTELFQRDLQAAVADPTVRSIVIQIDSPGGTVAGTQEAAAAVRAASQIKPLAAHVSGTAASAAYWIGSAAPMVMLGSATAQAGSIGVVATHTDLSRQQEAAGVKTTEIVAGKFKRAASQYAPLSELGRETLQAQVDQLYGIFIQDVATNRGVSPETVLTDMADGRVFIGQSAIDAGLVDGIASMDVLIATLNDQATAKAAPAAPPIASSMDPKEQAQQWALENPEAAAALRAEGAAAEVQRVADVRAQLVPGHEALIDRLATDGRSTGNDAARAIVQAERQLRETQTLARFEEAPDPVPQAPVPDGLESVKSKALQFSGELGPDSDENAIHQAALTYQASHPGVSYVDALHAISNGGI